MQYSGRVIKFQEYFTRLVIELHTIHSIETAQSTTSSCSTISLRTLLTTRLRLGPTKFPRSNFAAFLLAPIRYTIATHATILADRLPASAGRGGIPKKHADTGLIERVGYCDTHTHTLHDKKASDKEPYSRPINGLLNCNQRRCLERLFVFRMKTRFVKLNRQLIDLYYILFFLFLSSSKSINIPSWCV